jgi:hypothetical protein
MGVAKTLGTIGRGHPIRNFTGVLQRRQHFHSKSHQGDLRRGGGTVVITLGAFDGTDSFKVRVYSNAYVARGASIAAGTNYTDTVAFVRGTNATAAAIQTALRTATGDTALTVTGTTDAGPFTVTPGAEASLPRMELSTLSGCGGTVEYQNIAYHAGTGKPSTASVALTIPGTSGLVGVTAPLGTSVRDYDGTVLAPPTVASVVGTSGTLTVADTEVATTDGSESVFYAVRLLTSADPSAYQAVDADGDGVISIAAGNYAVVAFTLTSKGRFSRPSEEWYATAL